MKAGETHIENFKWRIASEEQSYDQRYGTEPQLLTQDTFNKYAGTYFTMNAPEGGTLKANEPTSWPQTPGERRASIVQGIMNYTWSSPDSVRILNIGCEKRDHTILDIKSTLNIGANALLSFVHAQPFVSETGKSNITGQGKVIAIYKSSLCLFNYGSLVCQSQELKGQSAEIALYNDSKMDLSTVDIFSDEGDFNVILNDNAHLTIKANQIVTLNGSNMIFNLSGESSCMSFSPANTHAPFDFTRERNAENGDLIASNFITADDENQDTEIIFDFKGLSLHARQQQAKKSLANGYLSLNGKVNTDEDTFFIYASAFNSQIVVSLSELQF